MLETAVLSVDRVNKHFGGIVAVKDMTFEVQAGEVLGLMGPNGAGKTTLLNLIAGVYPPDSGRVLFQGKDITRCPPHKTLSPWNCQNLSDSSAVYQSIGATEYSGSGNIRGQKGYQNRT